MSICRRQNLITTDVSLSNLKHSWSSYIQFDIMQHNQTTDERHSSQWSHPYTSTHSSDILYRKTSYLYLEWHIVFRNLICNLTLRSIYIHRYPRGRVIITTGRIPHHLWQCSGRSVIHATHAAMSQSDLTDEAGLCSHLPIRVTSGKDEIPYIPYNFILSTPVCNMMTLSAQ